MTVTVYQQFSLENALLVEIRALAECCVTCTWPDVFVWMSVEGVIGGEERRVDRVPAW